MRYLNGVPSHKYNNHCPKNVARLRIQNYAACQQLLNKSTQYALKKKNFQITHQRLSESFN